MKRLTAGEKEQLANIMRHIEELYERCDRFVMERFHIRIGRVFAERI